jgi:hypothetical protein
MFWSLSFQLMPDEEIVDDSTQKHSSGIKPAYSVFLTNKRAIFRFDGLGSSMTQSFFYNEILDIRLSKRLFFTYLSIKTSKRNFLLNTDDAAYWAARILETKKNVSKFSGISKPPTISTSERRKKELLSMLTVLRKNSLLTDTELEEKIHLLDSMIF